MAVAEEDQAAGAITKRLGSQPLVSNAGDALEPSGLLDGDALPQRGVDVNPGPARAEGGDGEPAGGGGDVTTFIQPLPSSLVGAVLLQLTLSM